MPHVFLGERLPQDGSVLAKDADLVGEGGVQDQIGTVLVGGNIQLLPPPHVGPQGEGGGHIAASEVHVSDAPTGQADPSALEHRLRSVHHVGAGGQVDFKRLRMRAAQIVIEGVDAFKHHHLILLQPDGLAPAGVPQVSGEVVIGDADLLPPIQGVKVLVEQVHVHAQWRLQVI